MTARGDLDRGRIGGLHARELARFRAGRPASLAMLERARRHLPNGTPMSWMDLDNDQPIYIRHGAGPGFTDVDGFTYLDFNASDMAMFCGHANPAVVRAIKTQAGRSTQYLLPTEASVEVAEELARRYPVPMWQFTLSATQANTEAIRLARAVTGRELVLLFQGHYHGHFEEGVVDLDGEQVAPLERGLSKGVTGRIRIGQFNDVEGLEEALAPEDVAIVLTEPAMTNRLHLLAPEPGWHEALRARTRAHGTLLALDETHTHVVGLSLVRAERPDGGDWSRTWSRSARRWYGPQPRTGAEAFALTDEELTRLLRIWLANRGVWEALAGAGPTVPVPATAADVDRYLQAYGELLDTLTR